MCAFLEIEIAFDNEWHAEIQNALNLNGIGNTLAQVEMPTGNTYIAMSTTPGYPQGGVLSSLKWSIVIGQPLKELTNTRIKIQCYPDDIV